jgi:hypothetical protein
MTAELTPTPTRLALLADVAAGNVVGSLYGHIRCTVDGLRRTVTLRIWDMHRAGWVRSNADHTWHLTDTGRTILDQHQECAA